MKNLSTFLSVVSLLAVIILFVWMNKQSKSTIGGAANSTSSNLNVPPSGKIAYIDVDSLGANYVFLKTKNDEFKKKQAQVENELQSDIQKMQSDYNEVQKKIQSKTITQPEYEAAQKRFSQMDQSLQTRKQALSDQLVKEQEDFNKELKQRIDNYLVEYNKDKHYDFIFSFASSVSGTILYANHGLNITAEVVNGLNELAKKEGDDKKKNK
jgi:outer membrane protein